MIDQASQLRKIVNQKPTDNKENKQLSKIITVTSGKGGVGKSNTVVNLALSLKEQGKEVVIIDADVGLANIEVLLGVIPKYNLSHVLNGQKKIKDIIQRNDDGIQFISGGSGINDLIFLDKNRINEFASSVSQLEGITDYIIVDTSAGINDLVLSFCRLAHEVIFITTPEPTSITDAYALIKTFKADSNIDLPLINILVNKAESHKEAEQVYKKLSSVCRHFLNIEIGYVGYVLFDYNIMKAAKLQEPVCKCFPKSKSSRAYRNIVKTLIKATKEDSPVKESLFKQVFKMFLKT